MQSYMPVFLQGAQTAPEQQSVLQPAPVDPVIKKLKAAKTNVDKYQKRVKCTSTALIVIGFLGMGSAFYHYCNAAKMADEMINGHHGHHPYHPHHNDTEESKIKGPKYVTLEQFELYDALKFMCSIAFFISCKIVALGKCGKWMAWANKSETTKKLQKKSCFGLVLILITCLFAANQGHHIHEIIAKAQNNKPHYHKGMEDNQEKEEKKRHLKVMSLLKDDEDDCSAFTSDSTCNAYPHKCSWCEAGAVADKCHSIANAMTLPSAVFKCSNLNEEVEQPIQEPLSTSFLKAVPEETCSTYSNEDSCNAGDCSWCKAGAVADKCHSIENGKRLPPAVF